MGCYYYQSRASDLDAENEIDVIEKTLNTLFAKIFCEWIPKIGLKFLASFELKPH